MEPSGLAGRITPSLYRLRSYALRHALLRHVGCGLVVYQSLHPLLVALLSLLGVPAGWTRLLVVICILVAEHYLEEAVTAWLEKQATI